MLSHRKVRRYRKTSNKEDVSDERWEEERCDVPHKRKKNCPEQK